MTKPLDMSGIRFGRLLVVDLSEVRFLRNGKRMQIWNCVCECGAKLPIKQPYLTSGDTKSCGCLRKEFASKLKMLHGMAHSTSTYDIWVLMRQRCNNKKASGYKYYGGLGVTVCDRWDNYELFLKDMGERPVGLTLDRKDPFGNYEPSNCRWATAIEQSTNKRANYNKQAHEIARNAGAF